MQKAVVSSILPSRGSLPTTQEDWKLLESGLRHYIIHYIYAYRITLWHGQEWELMDDVIQETFARAFAYVRKAECDDAPPIASFEALCKVIAKNYLLDLRRKDKHLVGSIESITLYNSYHTTLSPIDPAEVALQGLVRLSEFITFSQIILSFPVKQREALLVDLANKADFDDECPSLLEQALWQLGVSLREYRRPLPLDPVLRTRHSSLLSLAYKRLRQAVCLRSHQLDLAS